MNELFNKSISLLDAKFLENNIKAIVYTNYRKDVYEPITEIFIKVNSNIFSIRKMKDEYFRFDVEYLCESINRSDINFTVIHSKTLNRITNKVIKYINDNKGYMLNE